VTVAATIEIEAHAPAWLSVLLFAHWRKLSIDIDGDLGRAPWGTHRFVVAPGGHVVRVGLGAMTMKAKTSVHISANETVRLRYTPSLINHRPGTLEIVRVPSARVMR
jgi:hypothetical protein